MSTPLLARLCLLATLACLGVVAVGTASASAAAYTVETAVDQADDDPGDGECETSLGACTLRAAIEEVNLGADPANTIDFDPTVFNGQEEDTVFLATSLQTILYPVSIDAGSTCTTAGVDGAPCAGVTGTGADPVFAVEGDGSSISGLAITAGSIGIGVFGESTGFEASGNWIGIPMSGSNSPNNTGIFLGPGSDEAVIGGTDEADRNVIAWNEVGLDLRGASETKVLGNTFGLAPDGITEAGNDHDLVITDHVSGVPVTTPAAENAIGTDVGTTDAATPACDGGCNVFASASQDAGIDLLGLGGPEEAPATGPTQIEGNYLGLDVTGEELNNAAKEGIRVGTAPETTIGGKNPGQANRIHGSGYAITSGNGGLPAKKLVVEGNSIGRSLDGTGELDPPFRGIELASAGITQTADQARLIDNSISATNTGILQIGTGAVIEGNEISGGEIGIETLGSTLTSGIGNLIKDNDVLDAEEEGILIRNPINKVFGNEVLRAGEMGIHVESPSDTSGGNVIGGDSLADENAIFDSGAYAILISGTTGSRNEVRRNHGSGNEGEAGFIVLRPFNGPEKDPNGVKRPTIAVAAKTEASGKAVAGALVRVFRKASAEEGELAGFLGQATADSNGDWKVSYPAVPGETLLTATQTLAGGTSDLAETRTTPLDPLAPPAPAGGGSTSGGSTPPPDTTKPKATITKAPKAKSSSTTAKFRFSSDEAGSLFQCKLDGKAFAKCTSPKTYKKLKPGKHTFKLKAVDAAGNVSAVVKRKFEVVG